MTKNNTYILRLIIFLTIAVMGMSEAWGQDTKWDGTNYSFAENKFADEGLTAGGNDGKSWEKAYVITTARQLAYFAWIVKNNKTGRANAYYWKLGADIDLGSHHWSFGSNAGGAFQGHFDGGGHTISNLKLDVTTNSNYGLLTTIQGANSTTLAEVKNLKIDHVTFTSTTDRAGTTKLGALTGYVKNAKISGISVSNVSVTYSGNITGNNHIGGIVGQIEGDKGGQEQTQMKNCSVNGVSISLAGTFEGAANIGGAIGLISSYVVVDGLVVKGTNSITGPSADKIVKNNTNVCIGGAIGQQGSSGTTNYQPNKFMNVAVSGMTINLEHYVPAAQIQNHKFFVGGIAGCVNAPNQDALGNRGMPENLIAKGVKIYAPFAATSPTVPNFNAGAPGNNNLTPDCLTSVDQLEKSKTASWLYSDYKLGLSSAITNGTDVTAYDADPAQYKFRRNYVATSDYTETEGGTTYLKFNDSNKGDALIRTNRYLDNERDSKTVLWWTNQGTRDDTKSPQTRPAETMWTPDEQPIYPQSGATLAQAGNMMDYPYYMYFYQGISNATYTSTTNAAALIAGIEATIAQSSTSGSGISVTITNDKENERGFDPRTLTVKATDKDGNDVTSSYTYQWYINGKPSSLSSSLSSLTPHWKLGQGISVIALDNEKHTVASATYTLAPGVLKTKAGDTEKVRSNYSTRGTASNPYIIDCENALRQLSYLSTAHTNTYWENITKPASPFPTNQIQGHYNRAYYELGADITLTGGDFTPISHVGYSSDGSSGTYSTNYFFQGNFDGKGHKISGLRIKWGAGQYNGNNANISYGLFGIIGHSTASVKWGESATSNTVVKNLVIDGATLTHDVNNKTFAYYNGTNAQYCLVGVLAGMVSSNTTIQNIEIRNSSITDEGSSTYNLAARGLYVGGAIGSLQLRNDNTGNLPTNTKIEHIAAQVNINLTHPIFTDETAVGQLNQFNVGGIMGRFISTSATMATAAGLEQIQNVLPKYTIYSGTINAPKAWISPVLGALRGNQQNGNNFNNYSKQWEGNNNTAATQVNITNAQYYEFYISDEKITDTYPSNVCGLGSRSILLHLDGAETDKDYDARKYQGVNYDAKYIAAKGTSLELLNKEHTDGYCFVWDEDGTFVHLDTEDNYVGISLSREKDSEGKATNKFTAVTTGTTPKSYKWQVSYDGSTWHDISGATTATYTAAVSLKTKYIVAIVNDGKTDYRTFAEKVEGNEKLVNPQIDRSTSGDNTVFTFNLNPVSAAEGQFTTTYEWYKTSITPFQPAETAQTLTLIPDQMTTQKGVVWCKAIVSEDGIPVAEYFIISGATVVYVNGNGYTGNGAGAGNDSNPGTLEKPVLTIDKANSLLKSADDGGTVENNIIVVMGMLNEGNFFRSNGSNPATITGRYNNEDYEGTIYIMKTSSEDVVNPITAGSAGLHCYVLADTKFENLTFNGANEDNAFIECHGNDVWFGKGLVMTNFRNLSISHSNFGAGQNVPELSIILTATNLSKDDIKTYTNRTKPQIVTFESGHYGRIMGGRFTNKFFKDDSNDAHTILGSAANPVWAIVNIDIDNDNPNKGIVIRDEAPNKGDETDNYTCDINCIIAGLTDGSMYGDYEINVHGGTIGFIVGGNQGNPVPNGNAVFTPEGSTETDYNKGWGQWPNATYFGRTVINIEEGDQSKLKPVLIQNVYAGGLGRQANGASATSVVDMYFYGRTEVTMKSGTISGSLYAGGAGGVIGLSPWDAHVPYEYENTTTYTPDNAILNGVQYGDKRFGSWSEKTVSDKLASVTLHNLNEDGTYSAEQYDLGKSSTTVNISGGTIRGSVYGGGYGYVANMPVDVTMQGIGSIFGTSNINISGGTIYGSVYGGSQGASDYYGKQNKYGQTINHIAEMVGTVNMLITGTESQYPTINGNIYGGGKGIPTSKTLSTATAEDVAAGKAQNIGDQFYEEYIRIATAGNYDLAGSNANAEQKSKYKTDINITIDLPKSHPFNGNIYGGGQMGAVDGSTKVIIKDGIINGDVFGGCKGEPKHINKAKLNGKATIIIGNEEVKQP